MDFIKIFEKKIDIDNDLSNKKAAPKPKPRNAK